MSRCNSNIQKLLFLVRNHIFLTGGIELEHHSLNHTNPSANPCSREHIFSVVNPIQANCLNAEFVNHIVQRLGVNGCLDALFVFFHSLDAVCTDSSPRLDKCLAPVVLTDMPGAGISESKDGVQLIEEPFRIDDNHWINLFSLRDSAVHPIEKTYRHPNRLECRFCRFLLPS